MFNVQGNLPLCLMLISPLPFSLLYNALKNGKIVKHNQGFVLLNIEMQYFISDTLNTIIVLLPNHIKKILGFGQDIASDLKVYLICFPGWTVT